MTCLRLCCPVLPALPADTGHSDGCAAANRGASGDGLRPAGADTPGSGVTAAALCQSHDRVTAYKFACYNQGCLFFLMTHLCAVWFILLPPQHVFQLPELHVPQHSVLRVSLGFRLHSHDHCLSELCLFLAFKSKLCKSDVFFLLPNEDKSHLKRESYVLKFAEEPALNSMDPKTFLAVTSHHLAIFFF